MNSLVCGLLMLLAPILVSANTIMPVSDDVHYSINRQVEYLTDDSLELTLEDVRSIEQWQPITTNFVNLGFIKSAAWFRFQLQVVNSNDYILHLSYPILDYVDHYSFIDGEPYLEVKTGDGRNFDTRAFDHGDCVCPYRLEAGQTLTVYLRVKTQGSVDVPLTFSSKDLFLDTNTDDAMFRGFVLGVLILMLFYNGFIYFNLKDRLYGFYVLNIFTNTVNSNVYDGGAFKYLWPNMPSLNDYVFPVSNGLVQVTSIIFMMALLEVLEKTSWYKNYFLGLLAIVSTYPLLVIFLPYSTIVPLEVASSLLVYTSSLIFGIHLSLKGDRTAQYFTFATFLFIVGLLSTNLKSLGILPTNFFTRHGYQIGFFIDMVVLSMALVQKIDLARQERAWAQKENIKNLKRYQDLYSESLSGHFQTTSEGRLVSVNNAFLEILGYENITEILESRVAKDISLFSMDVNASKYLVNTVRQYGKVVDYEVEVIKKDGSAIWISISVRTVTNNDGLIEYYEGSIININERKINETLREQALKDRMSTLEQLVIGISHELNTPLGTSITGLSHLKQLLIEVTDKKKGDLLSADILESVIEEIFQALELTSDNLDRVRELIKQFKHVSVSQQGYEIYPVSLLAIISSALAAFNLELESHAVEVEINCDEAINVTTYGEAIGEIIKQLINNSLDHAFENETYKKIEISARVNNDEVVLIYKDNGKGLSDEGRTELFNPFYTTLRGYHGKVGLGMYLTFNLITQLLAGKIEIEQSEQGISILMKFPRHLR